MNDVLVFNRLADLEFCTDSLEFCKDSLEFCTDSLILNLYYEKKNVITINKV